VGVNKKTDVEMGVINIGAKLRMLWSANGIIFGLINWV
jgi:hypothetical protein